MILEYLIKNEEKARNVVSIITRCDLSVYKKKLNDDYFIITVYMKGKSEVVAKKLSDINDTIVNNYSPVVLTNGSAAYFNKVLFPLVNDFERKLRKLLYAASTLKSSEKETIENLEEKDFGNIFDTLFLDCNYLKKVKSFVNGSNKNSENWSGYSSELISFLSKEEEDILWDRLLPNQVPTLRKKFADIRFSRNDIMHAHNINKIDYNNTRKLFEEVNKELQEAIEGLADGAFIPDTYNDDINDAFYFVTDSFEYLTDQHIQE